MHKIWLIIQREYLTRVRKKSFLIMTIVGPVLMAGLMIVPAYLAGVSDDSETIDVLDESGMFAGKLKSQGDITFRIIDGNLEKAKKNVAGSESSSLLFIPKLDLENPAGVKLYGASNSSLTTVRDLEKILNRQIEINKLAASGIEQKVLDKLKSDIDIATVNLSEGDEKHSNAGVTTIIGLVSGFLIYIFIFLYGVQIMNGVIEEKTNRIVEVLISSVKPFQLMMGKILGIAAVGLTQFLLWIMISMAVYTFVASRFELNRFSNQEIEKTMQNIDDKDQAKMMNDIIGGFENVNVPLIVGCFLFYFLGGYLLYGAMFGAVGSAIDNDTDKQQFMLPITIPLIFSIIIAQSMILKNPDSSVAFWVSIIPLTSPIAMMMRLPFGVPTWQLLLSMALLVAGFFFTVWLAGRIYRVGILMYGKKVNYRELSRWLFYKG